MSRTLELRGGTHNAPGQIVRFRIGDGPEREGTVVTAKWSTVTGWWYEIRVDGVGTWSINEADVA